MSKIYMSSICMQMSSACHIFTSLSPYHKKVLHDITYLVMGPSSIPVQEAKGIILSPPYSNLAPAASRSSSSIACSACWQAAATAGAKSAAAKVRKLAACSALLLLLLLEASSFRLLHIET